MKYLEIVLMAVFINLSFAAVGQLDLDFTGGEFINSNIGDKSQYSDEVIVDGDIYCDEDDPSFSCRVQKYKSEKELRGRGVKQDSTQGSDNDFLKAISMFRDVFTNGIARPGKVYSSFFDDSKFCMNEDNCKAKSKLMSIEWMINIPVYIMYLIAIIQLFSGRNLETNK